MSNADEDNDKKAILAVADEWAKAIVANDAERIGSFMADEWVMVSERGVSTKEHFLSFVASGQLTHDAMDMAEFGQISIYGDTALLIARVTNTAYFGGKFFPADEWTSDVFVRTNGGWKCVMSHITPVIASK